MSLPPSGGFIASHAAQEFGHGVACPWRIQAHPGQRINLTLYDFTGRAALDEALSGGAQRTFCRKYALLQEEGKGRETPICGGLERIRNVYISEGPILSIRMLPSKDAGSEVYFAIKYESMYLDIPPFVHVTALLCFKSNEYINPNCFCNTYEF